MTKEKELQTEKEKFRSKLASKHMEHFNVPKTKKMQEEENKLETKIVLGGLAYMGERGDGIARPKGIRKEN
ncbi:hypothetical protein P4493_06325 [Bacillus thuringiensis]|uniref:Uncharacterized protein n=3 Tax=Bacillus thuringiensis TaxID=1428 RepID=A0A0B5NIQ4_BACTU|nr:MULTISPECIES: hypothetical protein [Bacillus]MEC2533179.1 hypothetical protein [Bacillus cereus]MED1153839.1 hypothetical protein [Bacillus paranthracis]AFQ30151.1 hypothetical protein BTF1_30252 [Bacillus thuringiensis HD-789]AJG73851.1 hypothetical protein BF38_5955 [Bacillus thuringiensis]AJH02609.1 hypothetical protein AS86_6402 [Bacillus thuringiensis HD1002]